jgi:hypothetical protein
MEIASVTERLMHAESEERVAHMISYTAKGKGHQNPCGNFSDTPRGKSK